MKTRQIMFAVKGLSPVLVPVLGITISVIGLVLVLSSTVTGCSRESTGTGTGASAAPVDSEAPSTQPGEGQKFVFGTPKKAAHYESNTPAHGMVLSAPPINVVIDFNFDLAPPSRMSIMSNGKEYGTGETN